MIKNWKILLILILGVHLFFLAQLKFTAWPEMLLWPYMMIHNLLPYKDIAIAHTPFVLTILSPFYYLFGVGISQLQIFTWILIIVTDLILFGVVKKIWNFKIALFTLIAYIPLSLFYDGNGLWFDLLLAPLAVLTFYFISKKQYLWCGVTCAVMFLTKQTAVWFLIPIGISLIKNFRFKILDFKKFTIGALLVVVLFAATLWLFGVLPDFYNWAIKFGIFVLPRAQGQIQLPDIRSFLVAVFPFIVFAPLFLIHKSKYLYLAVWAFVGMMGAYPRFEYFHFQPALPFLAIVSAMAIEDIKKVNTVKIFFAFYLLVSVYLFANYFMRNWNEGIRFYEKNVIDVVNYVKKNSDEEDKIFVMNWWDNIYPLTKTIPATDPWVPQLSWYQDIPGIQEKEVEDLTISKPKLIILQDYSEIGLASYKPQKVYKYIMDNYKLKEKIDGIQILIPR